jgi:hypothetical protein
MSGSLVIGGLHYLAGQTVSAFIGGLDCGDYVPDVTGSITVPEKSDPDGLFSAAYLVTISNPGGYGDAEISFDVTDINGNVATVYVPCVIGTTYTSQGQLLRPFDAQDTKSQSGPGLAKLKRPHFIGALLNGTPAGFTLGTDGTFNPVVLRGDGGQADALPMAQEYTGVYWDTVEARETFDAQVNWQITRPYPARILQIGPFLDTDESA